VLLSHHPGVEQVGPEEAPRVVPESSGQVSDAGQNVRVLPFNRIDLAERVFAEEGGWIAAVILEPVNFNSGGILPAPGYLAAVKELAHRHGALVIFDEIITGFRLALGGAQELFGVVPDLATFGKAVAGGAPLSLVAGRREILELMFGGGVSFGGTFNGNPVSLAAAAVTLEELARDNGAALVRANRLGDVLREGMAAVIGRRGVAAMVSGMGAAFAIHFTEARKLEQYRDVCGDDKEQLRGFLFGLLEEGVYALPDGRFYVSAVHSEEDIQSTLESVERVLGAGQ